MVIIKLEVQVKLLRVHNHIYLQLIFNKCQLYNAINQVQVSEILYSKYII